MTQNNKTAGSQKRQGTHKNRVGPLILMQVPVQDNIHPIFVQQFLHGFAHALIFQVVSGVCIQAAHTLQASKHK